MTAPADRSRRLTGGTGRPCRSLTATDLRTARNDAGRRGAGSTGSVLTDAELVDAEFAAIVARNGGADDGATAMPSAERCDRASGSTDLRDQIGRIASAVFCTSGLDARLLDFAIRRVAEHHAVDHAQVADRIADGVLQIVVSLAPAGETDGLDARVGRARGLL